jgi:hypothetical protein
MERRGAASLRCVRGEWRGSGAGGNGGGRGGDDTRVYRARIMWADEGSGGVCGAAVGARATAWGAGAARRGEARGAPRVARLRRAAAVAGATRLRGVGGAWRCVAGGWWRWWECGCGRRSSGCWERWRVCGGGECVCVWVVAERVKRVTRSGCGGGRARVVAARCGRWVIRVPHGGERTLVRRAARAVWVRGLFALLWSDKLAGGGRSPSRGAARSVGAPSDVALDDGGASV